MTTAAIRTKLMDIIANADDKKVKALYTLLVHEEKGQGSYTLPNDEMSFVNDNHSSFILTASHIEILDAEREKHLAGKCKSYTWEEAKKIIRKKK